MIALQGVEQVQLVIVTALVAAMHHLGLRQFLTNNLGLIWERVQVHEPSPEMLV
jgi:hypothetical protein